MTWIQIIIALLVAAAISAWALSHRERKHRERRLKDIDAWIYRNSEKQALNGFTYNPDPRAGYGNDETPSP